MPFLRQSYKQKPEQWGSFSDVQAVLFNRAEKIGINPADIALAMPLWGPGDQRDYSKRIVGTNNGAVYKRNGLYFYNNDVEIAPLWVAADDPEYITTIANVRMGTLTGDHQICSWNNSSSPYNGYSLLVRYGSGNYWIDMYLNEWSSNPVYIEPYKNITISTKSYKNTSGFAKASTEGKPYQTLHAKDTISYITAPTQNLYLGKYSGGDYLINSFVFSAMLVKSEISDNQIAFLAENPYYFWQPGSRIVYSVPAASGTTESIAGTVTFSGDLQRVITLNRSLAGSI